MKWIIEQTPHFDDLEPLVDEIKKQGHHIEFVKMFSDLPDISNDREPILFYGSLNMEQEVQKTTYWIPGSFCNLPAFNCTYYYPRFGKYLLNEYYAMFPFGELNRRKDFLYDAFGQDECIFIRPNTGNKVFTGQIVEFDRWDRDMENLGRGTISPEVLVIVARPRNIIKEWRMVIVDNQIIAASQYKPNKSFGANIKALKFAREVLDNINYSPDRAWCLDIAQTKVGNFGVIEVNSFSSSGLYKCDVECIVQEVSRVAIEEFEVYNAY